MIRATAARPATPRRAESCPELCRSLARVAPDRFARFLRAVGLARDVEAAAAFGVTANAAKAWLDGTSAPRLHVVIAAALFWPEAFAAIVLRGESAARAVR